MDKINFLLLGLCKRLEVDLDNIFLLLYKENNKFKLLSYDDDNINKNDINIIRYKLTDFLKIINSKDNSDLNDQISFSIDNLDLSYIIGAFEDRELAEKFYILISFDKITPKEQDYQKILDSIIDIDSLSQLVYEYQRFEDDIYEELNNNYIVIEDVNFKSIYDQQVARILKDTEYVKINTIGSAKAIEILYNFAKEYSDIDLSNELYIIQSGYIDRLRPENKVSEVNIGNVELINYNRGIALYLSFLPSDGIYSTQLVTLPAWAIDLLEKLIPSSVKSKRYSIKNLSQEELLTASYLFKDGGLYNNFDHAVIAAIELNKPQY
jgi:hypothetical protein